MRQQPKSLSVREWRDSEQILNSTFRTCYCIITYGAAHLFFPLCDSLNQDKPCQVHLVSFSTIFSQSIKKEKWKPFNHIALSILYSAHLSYAFIFLLFCVCVFNSTRIMLTVFGQYTLYRHTKRVVPDYLWTTVKYLTKILSV